MEWGIFVLCWFIIFAIGWSARDVTQKLEARLDRLEQKLDAALTQLGVAIESAKPPSEVLGLLQAGRKIEAIKAYRNATGAGLAEAKAFVEQLAAQNGLS